MKSVLFDTNIILDIALKREPHVDHATRLLSLIDRKEIIGYVTATTITDIYYIAKKERGHESTLAFISDLIEVVSVVGVDRNAIVKALHSEVKDFEDAVQVSVAESAEIEYVITRNTKDFAASSLEISNPVSFLEKHK